MKKLGMLILAAGMYTTASSQLYVQGGVNFANITKDNAGNTNDKNALTTFNAGILNRFDVTDMFAVETGVTLQGKGARSDVYYSDSRDDNYLKTTFNPLYVEVPLNAVVKIPLQNDMGIFLNAGPYAAIGVGGKAKWEAKVAGVQASDSETIEFSNDDVTTGDEQEGARYDRLKRFDYGLNFGGGLDLGRVMVKVNYGLGLNKINSLQTDNDENDKNKFRTWSISLGVPLSR